MKRRTLAAAVALWLLLGMAAVHAQETQEEEQTLEQKIEEQERRLKTLERKLELQSEAAETAAKANAVVKASPKGFSIESADKANVVKLRGTLHVDGRSFPDDITAETADTLLL